jgi:hypothetical protein
MGEALPCGSVMLFRSVYDAHQFTMDITSKWEALLTAPDHNKKVTNILKDTGYVRSLVAQLHALNLPKLQCIIGKGKSWAAPSGYGIVGPAISEILAIAYHAKPHPKHINAQKRVLSRDHPREQLSYLVCNDVYRDIITSKWYQQQSGAAQSSKMVEKASLERMGIRHYFQMTERNPLLDDEHCEQIRVHFEQAIREGYGRTLNSQMNLFDCPAFLSMMSVRSCIRTHLTCHELDTCIIERYRERKTILFCTVKGYPEPWKGYVEKISTLSSEGGAASKSGSEALKDRLKRLRMQALDKKQPRGQRGQVLPGISVEHIALGQIDVDDESGSPSKNEADRILINMEYWRNLLFFKDIFRDACEEVECYDKQPVHIGVSICSDPISACDMACNMLDRLTLLKRQHHPGNIRTSTGPLIGDVSFGIACGDVYNLDNEDVIGYPLERARLLSESLPVGHIIIDEQCLKEYARELNGKFRTKKVQHDDVGSYRLLRHS